MKKKLLLIVLCAAVIFSLTSCSSGEATIEKSTTAATTVVTTIEETSKSHTTTTKKETTTALTTEKTTAKKTADKKTTSSKEPVKKTEKKPSVTTTVTKSISQQSCYITIECKSILSNMDRLADGHAEFVPSDGYILKNYECYCENGDSAYDILKKACNEKGIKLTARSTVYGTYVSGINNLDEFDCGQQSGWLYSVNGKQPNISCGKYEVSSGDKIEFSYTCRV